MRFAVAVVALIIIAIILLTTCEVEAVTGRVPAICRLPKISEPCAAKPDICQVLKMGGRRQSSFRRYYYNTTTNKCTLFTYSGFRYDGFVGNENNFKTEEKCQKACRPVAAICKLPKDAGLCNYSHSLGRYYYDTTTKKCTLFIYGGCGGNKNHFKTYNECQKTCQGQSRTPIIDFNTEYSIWNSPLQSGSTVK